MDDMKKDNLDDFDVKIPQEEYQKISDLKIEQEVKDDIMEYRKRISPDVTTTSDYLHDKLEKKQISEHKRRDKIKGVKNKRVFRIVWFFMVVLIGLSLSHYLVIGSNDFFGVGRPVGKTEIEIPKDVDAQILGDVLAEKGVISSAEFFSIYCAITAEMDYFEPGIYTVETNLDYEALINKLQSGKPQTVVKVLLREGLDVNEIADILEENKICSKEKFLEAVNSNDYDNYDMIEMIDNQDEKYFKLEGYVFPDSYYFYEGEEVESVIGKMLYTFQQSVTKQMLEDVNKSKYSLDEYVVMASIIQAEAASTEDMYNISAIIHNRLEKGDTVNIFSLGMDSTQFYPYADRESAPEGYTSDYETYNQSGLPAGAICNPGLEALKAAIYPNPKMSDKFYFCHDKDRNAYYAATLDEHNANLIKAGIE